MGLLTALIVAPNGIPVPAMLNPTSPAEKYADGELITVEAAPPEASSTDRAPAAFSTSTTVPASRSATVARFRCSTSPSTLVTNVRGANPGPDTTRFTHPAIPVPTIPGSAVSATEPASAPATGTDRAAPLWYCAAR